MRLTATDINRLVADTTSELSKNIHTPNPLDSSSRPVSIRSAEDYIASNAKNRVEFLDSITSNESTSKARHGEILPPPPKSLKSHITTSNDFGLTPNTGSPNTPDYQINPDGSAPTPAFLGLQGSNAIDPNSSDSLFHSILPRALQTVDFQNCHSRAQLIHGLTQSLPLNELGLPKIIYRSDLLDHKQFASITPEELHNPSSDTAINLQNLQELLTLATIHIDYTQGFPTLPDSSDPLWGRLPFEGPDAFSAFLAYCELPGARQLANIAQEGTTKDLLQSWFHENYWILRAKAFDMMTAVHQQKMREQRILSCEDGHFKKADKLLQRLAAIENEVDFDMLVDDPKAYVDILDKVVKLQRQALGLSSITPNTTTQTRVESLEVALRKATNTELPALKMREDQINVRSLLRNPEALATAQELIVRMSHTTTTTAEDGGRDTEQ